MSDQDAGRIELGIGAGDVNRAEFERAGQQAAEALGKGFQRSSSGLFTPIGSKAAEGLGKTEQSLTRIDRLLKSIRQGEIFEVNDVKDAINLLGKVEAELERIARLDKRLVLDVDVRALQTNLRGAQQILLERIGTLRAAESGLTNFEQREQAKRVKAWQDYYNNILQIFSKGAQARQRVEEQQARESVALIRRQQQAENAVRREQERLGAQLAASINRARPDLAKEQAAAFDALVAKASGLTKVEREVKKVSSAFEHLAARGGLIGKLAGTVGGFVSRAETALSGLGLSVSNVAILFGAGFASGVAGLIQIGIKLVEVLGRMAAAVARFVFDAAKAGAELSKLRGQIQDTFGDEADDISQFAARSAQAFGISEKAALTYLGRLGQLFQAQGATDASSRQMAEGLLTSADILRRTTIGAGDYKDALDAVRNTVAGNIEGLREYNVFLTELDLRQIAAEKGIKLTSGAMDAQTRSALAGIAVIQESRRRLDEMSESERNLNFALQGLRSRFEDIKASIGTALAPAITFVVDAFGKFFDRVVQIGREFVNFIDKQENLKTVLGAYLDLLKIIGGALLQTVLARIQLFVKGLETVAAILNKAFERIAPLIERIQKAVDGLKALKEFLGLDTEAKKDNAAATDELTAAEDRFAESARKAAEASKLTEENLKKVIDERIRLKELLEDAERDEAAAELRLARAREDAAFRAQEAQRDLTEAIREGNERIADAREKLSDAEEKRDEIRADAARKREDERLDASRRIADAERALAEARRRRAQELLDATLSIEEALRSGDALAERRARLELSRAQQDTRVKDAARKLEEVRFDSLKKLQEAARDYAEAIEDADEAVADAREDLARVFEDTNRRIEDAERKLARTEVEINRTLFDAKNNLLEVQRKATREIEKQIEKVRELDEEYGTLGQTLNQLLDKLERIKNASEPNALTGGRVNPANVPSSFENLAEAAIAAAAAAAAAGFRQHGGPVVAGRPYIVGEAGRELFIPNRSGQVVSNRDLLNILGQLSRSGPSFVVNESVDGRATAEWIERLWATQLNP